LVELVNIHDPALTFEPIHRAVFGATREAVDEAIAAAARRKSALHFESEMHRPGAAQELLDSALALINDAEVDYIHGAQALNALEKQGALCFEMPAMPRDALFPAIRENGPLPKKAFSLGEADDKRFYLETRKIVL